MLLSFFQRFNCLLAVSVALVVAAFVTSRPAVAQAPASTLERLRESATIRIGYGDTPPFSYRTDEGEIVGYSIEICHRMVEVLRDDLGLKQLQIEYIYRTPRNRIQLLNDGVIDIECNASTNTEDRRKSAAFTYSHFYAATRFVALAKHGFKRLEDLRGRTVSVALGTINISQISDVNRELKLNLSVLPADGLQAAFDMVSNGQASAFAMDDVLLSAMIAGSERPDDFVLSEELVAQPQPYGFMVRLSDEGFRTAVNDALTKVYADPEMAGIYQRWFEGIIPGYNRSLQLPMSEQLRAALASPAEEPNR
ncbi:glutamate/aspartate transport system substrate-binding protein [Pseudorhizobium tarimense]|uniref:Glutamate/aspartate transport system substrate-binding protein n=1 Tax=Pseudorhizobium tarimense TaxID=1079109 RepID=A0ABV2HCI1_9HYPH|nr:amino acid ABC transporter substrate-binding protein [Pseudorhizobium tarimense]MCJ8521136.1 amino acid ABC transporter substrate-binding protein [Pseudorhizobium tarimense]